MTTIYECQHTGWLAFPMHVFPNFVIDCEGKRVLAHKEVLAARSSTIAKFTENWLHLPGVKFSILSLYLNWCYNKPVAFNWLNAVPLAQLASYLGASQLVTLCETAVIEQHQYVSLKNKIHAVTKLNMNCFKSVFCDWLRFGIKQNAFTKKDIKQIVDEISQSNCPWLIQYVVGLRPKYN